MFGTEHHELELELEDGGVDLEQLVWHLDEPLADLSSLGFLALCELARRHVTVALSGQGADELLGGYRKHRMASLVGSWQRIPRRGSRGRARPAPAPARLARPHRPRARRDRPGGAPARHERPGLRRCATSCSGALAEGAGAAGRFSRRSPARRRRAAPAALHLDGQLGLVDDMLTYFDRASMAHSLEVRVPFLDHHVVEFAATIPADLKVRRSLHRQARPAVASARIARSVEPPAGHGTISVTGREGNSCAVATDVANHAASTSHLCRRCMRTSSRAAPVTSGTSFASSIRQQDAPATA